MLHGLNVAGLSRLSFLQNPSVYHRPHARLQRRLPCIERSFISWLHLYIYPQEGILYDTSILSTLSILSIPPILVPVLDPYEYPYSYCLPNDAI